PIGDMMKPGQNQQYGGFSEFKNQLVNEIRKAMDYIIRWGIHTDIIAICNEELKKLDCENTKLSMNSIFNNCFGQMEHVVSYMMWKWGENYEESKPKIVQPERGVDIIEYPLAIN